MEHPREESLAAVMAALREMADGDGVWWGTIGATVSEVGRRSGAGEVAARGMIKTLQTLRVVEGPVRQRRPTLWDNGLREWRWQLLQPQAVIVKDAQGYFTVKPTEEGSD